MIDYTDLPDNVCDCLVLITALSEHHAQAANVQISRPKDADHPKYLFKRSFSDDNVRIQYLLGNETLSNK